MAQVIDLGVVSTTVDQTSLTNAVNSVISSAGQGAAAAAAAAAAAIIATLLLIALLFSQPDVGERTRPSMAVGWKIWQLITSS